MIRCLLLAVLLAVSACDRAPRVEVAGESLIGKFVEDGKVAAFLGVPFAEPPLGELRWRAPQALATKRRTREVTEFAAACMQSMRILDWYRSMATLFGGPADYYADLDVSEDCLYLNVWTPTLRTEAKLPVMIWVHGGGNNSGWSYELNYRGHQLAQENVVVVSVAYRQGVFGFLSHPELPRDEPVANFAYWDLLASLQWVHDHIEQFGGDPGRVTMFGESAGAQNILALMATDAADGLLHRGVAQSTAGFGLDDMSSLAAEEQRALELAAAFGLPPEGSLAALRKLPADELLATYETTFSDYYHSPAIDDQLLVESTWTTIHKRGLNGRELIIGSNDHEWYASTAPDTSWDDVAKVGDERAVDIVRDEPDPRRAMDRLQAAAGMLCPSQHVAATINATGGKAWMYHFTRVPEGEGGQAWGAWHGAEYPYVFATHDDYITITDADRALGATMRNYWVSFATTGNPNNAVESDWPRFEKPDQPTQEFGDSVLTVAAPEAELCALFEQGLAVRQ